MQFLVSWTITWILIGAVTGLVRGLGDTGHVSFSGTVYVVVTGGAIFGFVGGLALLISSLPRCSQGAPFGPSTSRSGKAAAALNVLM
jgi:hypothetical protein